VTDRGGAGELGLMIRLLPNQVVVEVIGEVDMVTAPDLGCLLGALVDRGHTDVVLDLANLDFLDSSGLQMIDDTSARLRPSGGVLQIRSPSARTRRLLDVSEVSGLVEFEPSEPDLVPLGSEQQADDGSTIVSATTTGPPVGVGRVAAMAAGHDVVDAALELVTALAQATVGGADGSSVSLARHGRIGTVGATDDTVAQMDRDQYATGQGPCLAAAGEGHWFHIESVAEEARWPDFVPRARTGGIGSILSTPLMAAGRSVGALNIYSRTERAFGPPEQELAALFATQASRILASAEVAAEQATRLQAALRVRELIAQAQGVVMARQGVSAEVASATLLRSSRQAHIPLRRQATEITASTQRQVPLTGSEP